VLQNDVALVKVVQIDRFFQQQTSSQTWHLQQAAHGHG